MRDNQCIYLSCNLSFGNTIWPGKDLFDISSAFWWPAEFVRRNPTSAANWIDHLNFSIRLCIVALFVALEFSSPPDIQEFVTSKTIQAALYLSRIALIAHQVLALLQSRSFGQFISEALPRLQLNSFMSIIPSILHLILLPCKLFIGRNPFTSLQNTPLLFGHMSLSGCITTLALATIVIEVCQQKLRLLNETLEQQSNEKTFDLEFVLARVAKEGVKLNNLIESTNRGLGPLWWQSRCSPFA